MLEDKWLLLKLKRGDKDVLRVIYEKYKKALMALAIALSNDKISAEDIVHDCFVSFARSVDELQLRISLKSYLFASVANRVCNLGREKLRLEVELSEAEFIPSHLPEPDQVIILKEQSQRIDAAIGALPYEQREVIILHLQSGLKFKQIAQLQAVSLNTIQSRYRYGLNKLQLMLNGEVEK